MTTEDKIKQINEEIKMLKDELDDQILLAKYYSGTDIEYKEYLEKQIKMKDRIRKISPTQLHFIPLTPLSLHSRIYKKKL